MSEKLVQVTSEIDALLVEKATFPATWWARSKSAQVALELKNEIQFCIFEKVQDSIDDLYEGMLEILMLEVEDERND